MYCIRCKKITDTGAIQFVISKNDRNMKRGTCSICGITKTQFVKRDATGKGFMNGLINKLPFEMHLPGHNFTGPGTKLSKRLNEDGMPKAWSKPINRVDEEAYHHDVCYAKNKDTGVRNRVCDRNMLKKLDGIYNPTLREKLDRSIVSKIIGTKMNFGMGLGGAQRGGHSVPLASTQKKPRNGLIN